VSFFLQLFLDLPTQVLHRAEDLVAQSFGFQRGVATHPSGLLFSLALQLADFAAHAILGAAFHGESSGQLWSLQEFPLACERLASLSGMKNGLMAIRVEGLTRAGGVASTAPRILRRTSDGDGIGAAIVGVEARQLRLEAPVYGAVLCGAIGDDQDLRAALFENQLGSPGAGVFERGGV